jgi:Spy/CpxP family protein refolding chaperone
MRNMKIVTVLVAACALVLCATAAVAQGRGPGGPPPAPEKNPKAWELEAKTVAQDIGLSAEQTAKLTEAYKAARESQMAAVMAKMGELGGGRRNFGAIREVNVAERAKLETALKAFLNPEQSEKALAPLGTFSRRWDPMVTALDGMTLEEKAKTGAMKLVAGFVAESDKAMQAAAGGNDFQAVREQIGKLKEKLDADMAKILSAEQMTTWTEASAMRRGPRGAGGPPAAAPAPAPVPAPVPAPAAK